MEKNFIYKVPVRLFDLDVNNHVNNSVYFTYMEEARMNLLLKEYLLCKEKGINFIVVEANCRFKRPILLQDEVFIEIIVKFGRGASFDIFYTFKDGKGKIYAEGKTQMACFDEKAQRPVRIPTEVIDSFQ